MSAAAISTALVFIASGGLSARRPRPSTRRARTLLEQLRERCEARGGACDCGLHRRPAS